jgi:hypothetical protein
MLLIFYPEDGGSAFVRNVCVPISDHAASHLRRKYTSDHVTLRHCVWQGWEYSAAMFIVLNTLALVFIGCSYWRMLRAVRSSGLSLRSTQERQDHALAQRFVVIVATDCLCWIPVIGVKLAALAGTFTNPVS